MQKSTTYRLTKEDILFLESLDQYKRRDVLYNVLRDSIKDEEEVVPTYEDLRESLYTYLPRTYVNDIINPMISDEKRHRETLSDLVSKMGCKNI